MKLNQRKALEEIFERFQRLQKEEWKLCISFVYNGHREIKEFVSIEGITLTGKSFDLNVICKDQDGNLVYFTFKDKVEKTKIKINNLHVWMKHGQVIYKEWPEKKIKNEE